VQGKAENEGGLAPGEDDNDALRKKKTVENEIFLLNISIRPKRQELTPFWRNRRRISKYTMICRPGISQ
jgi:hypothetical protein